MAVLLAATVLPAFEARADTAAGEETLRVVVMGDSYSAGTGAPPFHNSTDHVDGHSHLNYGEQYKTMAQNSVPGLQVEVKTVAVHGAELSPATPNSGQPGDVPIIRQLDGIGRADVVMLTAGGNDARFSSIVANCLVTGLRQSCDSDLNSAAQALPSIGSDLTALLGETRRVVGNEAVIAVIGYPLLERRADLTIYSCQSGLPSQYSKCSSGDRELGRFPVGQRLQDLQRQADALQASVVAGFNDPNMVFISIIDAFAGHSPSALGDNGDSWLTTQDDLPRIRAAGGDIANLYHPNAQGYEAIGRLVLSNPAVPPKRPMKLLLVDVSGSMKENGKLDQAKQALRAAVANADKSQRIGLDSYSGGCGTPIAELVPLGLANRDQLDTAITNLSAGGSTPMAPALEQARAKLAALGGGQIVLVADGQNDCKDICNAIAQAPPGAWVNTSVSTVGYGIAPGSKAERELRCVADGTGGTYQAAPDGATLTKTIDTALTTPQIKICGTTSTGQLLKGDLTSFERGPNGTVYQIQPDCSRKPIICGYIDQGNQQRITAAPGGMLRDSILRRFAVGPNCELQLIH